MQTVLKCNDVIIYANIVAAIENFTVSSRIDYICIAPSQDKFVLPNLLIVVNLSKCEKALLLWLKDLKASQWKDKKTQ